MADQDKTGGDAPTPQDQFKPAESRYGQDKPSQATDIRDPGGAAAGASFNGDLGASGHVAEPGHAALTGNDQAQPGGGGLGQNQQGYGQSPDLAPEASGNAAATDFDAHQEGSAGIGARPGTLGASPSGGSAQPASAATGGPDLSKGLADANRGSGSGGGASGV